MNPNPSPREIRRAVECLRMGREPADGPAVGPNGERIEVELSDEDAAELREWRRSPGEDMSTGLAEAIRSAEMAALTEVLNDHE